MDHPQGWTEALIQPSGSTKEISAEKKVQCMFAIPKSGILNWSSNIMN
jgi:hypothetical protein